jgi:MFS family permease
MFPISYHLAFLFLIVYALAGLATGTLTGFFISIILRMERRELFKDALLGSLGFLTGVIGCALVPSPKNTITYYVGQTLVQSTASRYQHPVRVAFFAAVVLPLVRELYHFRRFRSGASPAPR